MKKPERRPIPPLTCDHIDRTIELVREVREMAKQCSIGLGVSDNIIDLYVSVIEAELEVIRQSNDELRVASKFWYDKLKATRKKKL